MKKNSIFQTVSYRFAKISIYLLIVCFALSGNALMSQNLEQGVKYLKLGNTYMNSNNYENAKKYLDLGYNIVSGKSSYWEAAANEYLGYYYLEAENNTHKALSYLNKALTIYNSVLDMPEGSQEAVKELMNMIDDINGGRASSMSSNKPYSSGNPVMNYDNQKLRELPGDVPANIANLSLADNKFSDFPKVLTDFSGLEFLNLADNKLKEIPEDISKLQNLVYLNLSGNKLKNLPAGFCNMQNLRMLDLKDNKIEFEDIANLIRCLPNTNILFDKYIKKDDDFDGFGFESDAEKGF